MKVGLKTEVKVNRKSIALSDEAIALSDQATKRMKANKNLTGSVSDRVSKAASAAIVREMKKMIKEIDDLERISTPIV